MLGIPDKIHVRPSVSPTEEFAFTPPSYEPESTSQIGFLDEGRGAVQWMSDSPGTYMGKNNLFSSHIDFFGQQGGWPY